MYDVQPLPDFLIHTRFKLISSPPAPQSPDGTPPLALAAGARLRGVVDLTTLRYHERPDLMARMSVVANVDCSFYENLLVRWIPVYERVESNPRYDIFLRLHLEVQNLSSSALTILPEGAPTITLTGVAAAILPKGYVRASQRALGILGVTPQPVTNELTTRTMAGITFPSKWQAAS